MEKSLSKEDKKQTDKVEAALNKYCANKQLDRKQKKAVRVGARRDGRGGAGMRC